MRLSSVKIANFKAIASTTLDLSDFNVIVGANGSGKSSVLQAMHWMFQSGRNRGVEARSVATDGATLSEKNASYMPSPQYRSAGKSAEYGNKKGQPQLDMTVVAVMDDGSQASANLWIKSARNEGILVHVPTANAFVARLRDQSREFSAYIPGLAGIPLSEEKRSQAIVHRLAAAGDANTVLRNVLHLLDGKEVDGRNGLRLLEEYASQVLGTVHLKVGFEDSRDSTISAQFMAGDMTAWRPLELAGIGYLQIIQIFAYLLYFRPALLLIDEPDAHLHPSAQERLVPVLVAASQKTDTQVVMTTHSPSVVRSLPISAKVIWMKDGVVQPNGDTEGRQLMGWGLLDKKILMLTEDEDSGMIRTLLSQWPHLDRAVAVWPMRGSGKLPEPDVIKDFVQITAGSLKVVIHRDRDFLMPDELASLKAPYEQKGHVFWVTMASDMEAYWTNATAIAAHFNVDQSAAESILSDAVTKACENDKALITRRKKRNDASAKLNRKGGLPNFSDAEVEAEAAIHGQQYAVMGKDLRGAVRDVAHTAGHKNEKTYSELVPASLSGQMATDLRDTLNAVLGI